MLLYANCLVVNIETSSRDRPYAHTNRAFINVDFSKAFNFVNHRLLIQKLRFDFNSIDVVL